jgi:hypothetical protein
LETIEDRVLAMESVLEGGSSLVHKSLEGSMSSPNPKATEAHKPTSASVANLEYYYPKYSHDPHITPTIIHIGQVAISEIVNNYLSVFYLLRD